MTELEDAVDRANVLMALIEVTLSAATAEEALSALSIVLVEICIREGFSKESAMRGMSKTWDDVCESGQAPNAPTTGTVQ